MCLILDNNQWGDFLNKKPDMLPIHNWLDKQQGKLVYSNHEGFNELSAKYQKSLKNYKQQGKTRFVPKEKVEEKMKEIKKSHQIKSNDTHILGLAKAESVKALCSKDRNLHEDFKEIIKGHVYQTKAHEHLLTRDLCP